MKKQYHGSIVTVNKSDLFDDADLSDVPDATPIADRQCGTKAGAVITDKEKAKAKAAAAKILSGEGHGKQKKSGKTAGEIARSIVHKRGFPIISIAGAFFCRDEEDGGWVEATKTVQGWSHAAKDRPNLLVLESLKTQYASPDEGSKVGESDIYFWFPSQGEAEKILEKAKAENKDPAELGYRWQRLRKIQDYEWVLLDGVYNVRDRVFTPHEGYVWGPIVSIRYKDLMRDDTGEDKERVEYFEKTLAERIPDRDIREYFIERISDLPMAHSPWEKAVWLIGESGTCKSAFAAMLATAPGGKNGAGQSTLSALRSNRFESLKLVGKFVNPVHDPELDKSTLKWWKSFSTGDMRVEKKGSSIDTVFPTAKFIVTVNDMPESAEASRANEKRMDVFEMHGKYNPPNRTGRKYRRESSSTSFPAWRDPLLRRAILKRLLAACEKIEDFGESDPPQSYLESKGNLMDESDDAAEVLRRNIQVTKDESDFILFQDIEALLESNKCDFPRRLISRKMTSMFGVKCANIRNRQNNEKSTVDKGYRGIRWAESED